MSTAAVLPLITVEDYNALPDPVGDFRYELHLGELVKVGQPRKGHCDLQDIICDVLTRKLNAKLWRVRIEMRYGLTRSYDARATDVGVVSREVWNAVPKDGFLIGSPVLVVEVKSPSNRDRAMERDAILHITHGACAVWIAKEDARQIVQVTASSRTVHGPGDVITLPAPLSITIAVDEIFPR